ncbi:hypothetical protein OG21DRAFT_906529 [Imleria badia]|nr:hypothetical protein OG21DRAFT_906529 [Imleria badia]
MTIPFAMLSSYSTPFEFQHAFNLARAYLSPKHCSSLALTSSGKSEHWKPLGGPDSPTSPTHLMSTYHPRLRALRRTLHHLQRPFNRIRLLHLGSPSSSLCAANSATRSPRLPSSPPHHVPPYPVRPRPPPPPPRPYSPR